MKKAVLLSSGALMWGMLVFSGCHESSTPNDNNNNHTTDYCGDIKAAIFEIRNGVASPDPGVANLTAAQQLSVGALLISKDSESYLCTGTLVAPNVVLTAAHCTSGGVRSISFFIGQDISSPDAMLAVTGWHAHPSYGGWPPDYDIGVVILAGDPLAYGMTPIPINCVTMRLVGQTIQAVGYGQTHPLDEDNSERWWTTMLVSNERSNYYTAYGYDTTGTCHGDSGGPMLFTKGDGNVYVMGVVSSGDRSDCFGHTFYPRTDYHCGFLDDYITLDPCMGETYQGRCNGYVAIWCEGGSVISQDCSEMGYSCTTDTGGNYRCVAPPDACEGETYQGRCDGDTAIWCDLERVLSRNCADYAYICDLDAEGNYRCVEPPDYCEGETFAGRCEGNVAVWCEENTVMRVDCGTTGYQCAQGWTGLFRCLPPDPLDPCSGETFEGRCDGNTAIWCEAETVNNRPCPEGTLCGNLGEGLFRCVDECMLIGREGRCTDDNKVRWCQDGVIKVRDCGICEQVCGWLDDLMGNYCI